MKYGTSKSSEKEKIKLAEYPEIWQMIDEMLVAQEQWLPQYTEAIKAAKEHLANDPLIPTKDYHGAARLREKTPEEVAAERDARKITA